MLLLGTKCIIHCFKRDTPTLSSRITHELTARRVRAHACPDQRGQGHEAEHRGGRDHAQLVSPIARMCYCFITQFLRSSTVSVLNAGNSSIPRPCQARLPRPGQAGTQGRASRRGSCPPQHAQHHGGINGPVGKYVSLNGE